MASPRHSPTPDTNVRGSNSSPDDPEEEGEQDADLPLTMAASVVLTSLPRDAHEALEAVAKDGEGDKGNDPKPIAFNLPCLTVHSQGPSDAFRSRTTAEVKPFHADSVKAL